MSATYFDFPITRSLLKDVDPLNSVVTECNVYLLCYHVCTSGKQPFLQFLLANKNGLYLEFPEFPNVDFVFLKHHGGWESHVQNTLESWFQQQHVTEYKIQQEGYFFEGNNLYCVVNISGTNYDPIYISKKDSVMLVTLHEIMETGFYCNIPVTPAVRTFFVFNCQWMYLEDEEENVYEAPIILYNGNTFNKSQFQSVFGVVKDKNDMFEYRVGFHDAVEDALVRSKQKKDTQCGVVRVALFADIEQTFLRTEDIDNTVSFKDPNTAVGVTNGNYVYSKWYEQQLPLSYHSVDKFLVPQTESEYYCAIR